ncbi:hypothetical protein L2E82_34098 [Cichorium intybus]|uniref:Uncharacterized protein n=1 Tax=Cichorium intybus TaxID=13427 RepID=A0ACB9BLM6_CICIN|nr:hypothetical protein L2E82_34098 [Cichorium intybus]
MSEMHRPIPFTWFSGMSKLKDSKLEEGYKPVKHKLDKGTSFCNSKKRTERRVNRFAYVRFYGLVSCVTVQNHNRMPICKQKTTLDGKVVTAITTFKSVAELHGALRVPELYESMGRPVGLKAQIT